MNNVPSQFTIYEVLRIILPGFYIIIMVNIINSIFIESEIILFYTTITPLEEVTITFILSILIGGFIYSFDLPRAFKGYLNYLPTNLIKINFPEDYLGPKNREGETNYYNFYYNLSPDAKVKTEIQSGFYHFFVNLSFISLLFSNIFLGLFVFLYFFYNLNSKSLLFFLLNRIILIFGIFSALSIYKFRLRFSWLRDFENYKSNRKIQRIKSLKKRIQQR